MAVGVQKGGRRGKRLPRRCSLDGDRIEKLSIGLHVLKSFLREKDTGMFFWIKGLFFVVCALGAAGPGDARDCDEAVLIEVVCRPGGAVRRQTVIFLEKGCLIGPPDSEEDEVSAPKQTVGDFLSDVISQGIFVEPKDEGLRICLDLGNEFFECDSMRYFFQEIEGYLRETSQCSTELLRGDIANFCSEKKVLWCVVDALEGRLFLDEGDVIVQVDQGGLALRGKVSPSAAPSPESSSAPAPKRRSLAACKRHESRAVSQALLNKKYKLMRHTRIVDAIFKMRSMRNHRK